MAKKAKEPEKPFVPLNERPGRCSNCAGAHFESKIHKHQLLRRCRNCNEVYNIDTEAVVRKGEMK